MPEAQGKQEQDEYLLVQENPTEVASESFDASAFVEQQMQENLRQWNEQEQKKQETATKAKQNMYEFSENELKDIQDPTYLRWYELVRGKILLPENRAKWQISEETAYAILVQGRKIVASSFSILERAKPFICLLVLFVIFQNVCSGIEQRESFWSVLTACMLCSSLTFLLRETWKLSFSQTVSQTENQQQVGVSQSLIMPSVTKQDEAQPSCVEGNMNEGKEIGENKQINETATLQQNVANQQKQPDSSTADTFSVPLHSLNQMRIIGNKCFSMYRYAVQYLIEPHASTFLRIYSFLVLLITAPMRVCLGACDYHINLLRWNCESTPPAILQPTLKCIFMWCKRMLSALIQNAISFSFRGYADVIGKKFLDVQMMLTINLLLATSTCLHSSEEVIGMVSINYLRYVYTPSCLFYDLLVVMGSQTIWVLFPGMRSHSLVCLCTYYFFSFLQLAGPGQKCEKKQQSQTKVILVQVIPHFIHACMLVLSSYAFLLADNSGVVFVRLGAVPGELVLTHFMCVQLWFLYVESHFVLLSQAHQTQVSSIIPFVFDLNHGLVCNFLILFAACYLSITNWTFCSLGCLWLSYLVCSVYLPLRLYQNIKSQFSFVRLLQMANEEKASPKRWIQLENPGVIDALERIMGGNQSNQRPAPPSSSPSSSSPLSSSSVSPSTTSASSSTSSNSSVPALSQSSMPANDDILPTM